MTLNSSVAVPVLLPGYQAMGERLVYVTTAVLTLVCLFCLLSGAVGGTTVNNDTTSTILSLCIIILAAAGILISIGGIVISCVYLYQHMTESREEDVVHVLTYHHSECIDEWIIIKHSASCPCKMEIPRQQHLQEDNSKQNS